MFIIQHFVLPLLATLATTAASAIVITNNPSDVIFRADFPQGNSQTVVGVIQFYALNGTTKVHVDITGLPKNSGLFSYHIHEGAIDKDCVSAGTHFNPYGASSDCDAMGDDSLCEIGDLSGKHGLINTTCFEMFYYDPYLGLDTSSPQYIGGKSIVIHFESGERLACATIHQSRDPEDLLLLNAETEAEEFRKFEALAGIIHSPSFHSSAVVSIEAENDGEPDNVNEPGVADTEDPSSGVETEEDSSEAEAEFENEDGTEESVEEFTESDEDEEISKYQDYISANSTNTTVFCNSTLNDTDDDDDEEENSASSLRFRFIFVVTAAITLALAL